LDDTVSLKLQVLSVQRHNKPLPAAQMKRAQAASTGHKTTAAELTKDAGCNAAGEPNNQLHFAANLLHRAG
jgi:hypothetical protein